MGFQFKPKLAALMAVINGIAVGASYIVTAGDVGVTMRARKHASSMAPDFVETTP